MDQTTLESLVAEGLSQREIAVRSGLSQSTIKYWLARYGLKTNKLPYDDRKGYCCRYCGETEKEKFAKRHGKLCHTICLHCDSQRSTERFRQTKIMAVEYKGGKCEKCGYDKCVGSLHFHHIDPGEKDPNFHRMKCWAFERVKKELDKCQMVCANCHGEIHW